MRRAQSTSLTDPVTGLPSSKLIEEQLKKLLMRDDWAILYVVINHMDAFIEVEDIVARDDILRFVAMNLNETVEAHGTSNDFIGHTSGNDFIIITVPTVTDAIKTAFAKRFDEGVPTFYDFITRQRGRVIYTDQDGNQREAPLMSLSVGVLMASDGPFSDIRMLAAEARRRALRAGGG
jgi:GGDEF domain-containing protein